MALRNMIFAIVAVALSSVALAGIVSSKDYARAARYEASGVHALTEQLDGSAALACADTAENALLSSVSEKGTVRQ